MNQRVSRRLRMGAALLTALFLLAPILPPSAQALEPTVFVDFEDGTLMGFDARGTDAEKAAGTGVLTVVTEEARSGEYSLLTTERKSAWNGPALNVASYIVPDVYCEISVWVLPKTPESSTFMLSTQVGQGGTAEYFNLDTKTVSTDGGWTELTGRFSYAADDFITVYVENNTASAEFYIDDLSFTVPQGSDEILDSIALPSLREMYQDYFLLGSAFSRQDLAGRRFELVKRHFNVMTAGNAMKPDALGGRSKGDYNFGNASAMIDTLEEAGIAVVGHTLVWHSQSAAWLNKNADGTLLTRAEARANMEEYIHTVAGHFAGRVIAWDVVNEAFQSNPGDAPDWRDALRVGGTTGESAPWFGAYENGADFDAGEHGADYIYDAFVFARLADPNAILYYNDFNEEYAGKREVIAKMAEDLNEKWKTDPRNTEPDRLLVEGLGLQAHYWTNFLNPKDVEDTIVRWAATGAEISITELDIPAGSYGSYKALDEDEARKQATLYAELFQIFKKHSDSIARVSIWGIDDPTSWRGEGSPLLFGENTAVKPAFFAVMDPEGYLAGEYDDLSRTDLSQWGGEASAEPDPASPDGGKETPAPAEPSTPAPTPEPEPESDGDGSWNANLYAIAAGIAGVAIIVVLVLRLRKPKGK